MRLICNTQVIFYILHWLFCRAMLYLYITIIVPCLQQEICSFHVCLPQHVSYVIFIYQIAHGFGHGFGHNLFLLPFSPLIMCLRNLKNGNDPISKRIIRDPKAINLIAESLTGTTDHYFIGNCERNDGTRFDMVLEPKSAHSDLLPLILEIQHTVDLAFMKRAVNYCLQASTRYDIEPIILTIRR